MKSLILIAFILVSPLTCAADVKDADLAGSWYPESGPRLSSMLDEYLQAAKTQKIDGELFAIVAPHAGYHFSGSIAAHGYRLAGSDRVETVILIGFTHRLPFDGISVYDKDSFRTPLGDVAVDAEFASKLKAANRRVFFYPDAFSGENSIEMQIPFIQKVFKNASIVPIAFGGQSYDDALILADALASVLKDRKDYLVVASTDLSHYHPYEQAIAIDKRFIALLEKMNARDLYEEAVAGRCELCGVMPVTATLLAAEKLGFGDVAILAYANSGDTSGDKSKVVGYLSAAIYKKEPPMPGSKPATKGDTQMLLNKTQQARLLHIARESMTNFVGNGKRTNFSESDPVLNEPMGAFVTLHEEGQLRGCIGNMIGQGPLYKTVADMAIEAATQDPRFTPLSPGELGKVDVEISVLSPMKKVSGPDDITIPGNGVVVRKGSRSGVYLPQVADETGWSKEEFLSSLCAHKAGLCADAWKDPATELYVFTAEVFGEKESAE